MRQGAVRSSLHRLHLMPEGEQVLITMEGRLSGPSPQEVLEV